MPEGGRAEGTTVYFKDGDRVPDLNVIVNGTQKEFEQELHITDPNPTA